MDAAQQPSAETLLSAFKTIAAAERRKHATVLNYWLSIRGDKEFPPLHDLDPLEISDAGPHSILLELISGGHDAEVRHLGDALKGEGQVAQINEAPSPSILASIAKKLPIVAISRDFLAFEDEFETKAGPTRCWVTLLPLSAGGAWVDYVYALVSFAADTGEGEAEEAPKEQVEATADVEEPEVEDLAEPVAEVPTAPEPEKLSEEPEAGLDAEPEQYVEDESAESRPGFSKLLDSIAGLTGFYGAGLKVTPTVASAPADNVVEEQPVEEQPVEETPTVEDEAVVGEPAVEQYELEPPAAEDAPATEQAEPEVARAIPAEIDQPIEPHVSEVEGTLQNKLADVRAKADEARQAKLRANAALYEGLSAAYDFALDAEGSPEEYLKLVEAQGLKIQLRNPMLPVVKLAFDGMCDATAITQLEAVLAWALEQDLPKGSLAERIEAAGGIAPILNPESKAAA
jgi:hypothetical protein